MSWGTAEKKILGAFQRQISKGIEETDVNTFISFSDTVLKSDYDLCHEAVVKLSKRIREACMAFVMEQLKSKNPSMKTMDVSDNYWRIVLMEAQNRQLDSYLRYLEKDREAKRRFYIPRARQLNKIGVVQMLQDMLDDKYDLCSISLVPGAGKAQPLYAKVLTPTGFTLIEDIHIGDIVIAGNGKLSTVMGVYPQGKKEVYEITLADGRKCRCSTEHLWNAIYWRNSHDLRMKTVDLKEILDRGYSNFYLPVWNEGEERYTSNERYVSIKDVKYIGNEECQCIYIDNPCHLYITDDYIITHNTTLERFFATGVIGWFPDDFSLFYSHSDDIVKKFYDDALEIVTNNVEYRWGEIFPNLKVTSTDAATKQFNVGDYKAFPSLQGSSVGAKSAGKVRAKKFLYVDDMIGTIEEAMNINILNKLWDNYSVNARQRKLDGCKELHIATRWSVHDIIGRLQVYYEGNPRAKFLAVPAIDPQTGKSNFDYDVEGFSVSFFHNQQLLMDDISYNCLYNQEPMEREGRLYTEDEMRFFFELPEGEPDAIVGICDTKSRGDDYMFLPCVYQYGEDYYLADCVCDNAADFNLQEDKVCKLITDNNMQMVQFESNVGGDRFAANVQTKLKAMHQRCTITTKPTESNKETKIIVNAPWVKQHILFKDKTLYSPKSDYGIMMHLLLSYSVVGSQKHKKDDVPDGLAMLALFVNQTFGIREMQIVKGGFLRR